MATTVRSTGTWQKADEAQKQKNVGAVDQSSVQSTSSWVMAISDQGERVDAHQVLEQGLRLL